VTPDKEFADSVEELIDDAERTHPGVAAAKAQLEAAVAKQQQTWQSDFAFFIARSHPTFSATWQRHCVRYRQPSFP
jgi:hypothetical protein